MAIETTGLTPRLAAVTVGFSRFDLTRWDGVMAWLNAGASPSECFHIHTDDIAATDAALKEEIDA
ncbi:hypothetical protein EN858_21745 [Mesorhizobium sp. M4B.F.Ca.ET.215.01.1.1]|nr:MULTISPECIES: hypothetical protein [unclassified Mesorhizobium]RUW43901.1 hypothetical protein EOA32_37650 [Mesorhizobium sp. M1A.F.Ca.ET.072.01.1.1]TGQ08360.1 hypothetical protein EN858_21745 [Mesorhizobium sp. M4B.F.Ca.ET.215.01.1.1]TGQ41063.1 hypothetical protein EN863_021860 [Mesorhizobium sp. M00.F.Ca.ET.220.01.1.1]TGR01917.1 hypothetical protein EN846_18605 [Mesorhizobium sp. M4B.F.Ca.ET.203.01.1.1]TGT45398.1 hypothetical protein EN812_09675 [Mesorhizobium sp. M4B.F.Ca.ET.169.01.1.1]